MEEYDASYFKEIFPEDRLEEYMRELEKIWNKNGECNTGVDCGNGECDGCDDTDYAWFYMKKVPCFIEENENVNEEIKDENLMKNESSINPHNSTEIMVNNEVEENNLIDQYDEETVLLQIPQDDTRVEDVMQKLMPFVITVKKVSFLNILNVYIDEFFSTQSSNLFLQ